MGTCTLLTAKRWAKTWKRAMSGENGQASLNVTGSRTLPRVTAKAPKTAKHWARTLKRATSGENREATLNVTRTRTLPRVTAEMPENG
jgi:hypothetical protein